MPQSVDAFPAATTAGPCSATRWLWLMRVGRKGCRQQVGFPAQGGEYRRGLRQVCGRGNIQIMYEGMSEELLALIAVGLN